MTLFDPDDYIDARAAWRPPRTPRKPSPPVEGVPIHADATWRLVQRRHPGVVHAERPRGRDDLPTAKPTWCGVLGTPLTFDPGQVVNGCPACLEAMRAAR